jgi:hypothetical protein
VDVNRSTLDGINEHLSRCLNDALAYFKPGAKITLVIRTKPGNQEGDVVIGNDEIESAVEALRARQTRPSYVSGDPKAVTDGPPPELVLAPVDDVVDVAAGIAEHNTQYMKRRGRNWKRRR